jgi:hypothetical protein
VIFLIFVLKNARSQIKLVALALHWLFGVKFLQELVIVGHRKLRVLLELEISVFFVSTHRFAILIIDFLLRLILLVIQRNHGGGVIIVNENFWADLGRLMRRTTRANSLLKGWVWKYETLGAQNLLRIHIII